MATEHVNTKSNRDETIEADWTFTQAINANDLLIDGIFAPVVEVPSNITIDASSSAWVRVCQADGTTIGFLPVHYPT